MCAYIRRAIVAPALLLVLVLPTAARADSNVVPSLNMVVNTWADVDPHQTVHRLVFSNEDVMATVKIGLYRLDERPQKLPPDQQSHVVLPERWWESLEWDARTADGIPLSIEPRLVSNGGKQSTAGRLDLSEGDSAMVRMNLGRFTPGVGVVTVRLNMGKRLSATDQFTVREGNEDLVTRRTYLRAKLARTANFDDRKSLLQKLAKLEPNNPQHLEILADESIGRLPVTATLRYYDEAIQIYRANAATWYETHRKSPDDVFDREIARITGAADLVQQWAADRDDLEIRITRVGGHKEYSLVRRRTGDVLRRSQ